MLLNEAPSGGRREDCEVGRYCEEADAPSLRMHNFMRDVHNFGITQHRVEGAGQTEQHQNTNNGIFTWRLNGKEAFEDWVSE